MKPIKYRDGSYKRTPAGHWQAKIYRAYRRYTATLPTERQARIWLDTQSRALEDAQAPLSPQALDDARAALALLPDGVTLAAAAEHYRRTAAPAPILVGDALAHYRQAKIARNLKPTSLETQDFHLRRFAAAHAGRRLHELTPLDLARWLDLLELRPVSRANHIRYLGGFFRWCVKSRLLQADPTDALETPRTDQTLPGILEVGEVRALLQTARARDPRLIPYLALALFAGLRQSELLQIPWTALADPRHPEHIHIGPGIAKARQQRYVTRTPNLAVWLDTVVRPASSPDIPLMATGPILPPALRARLPLSRALRACRLAAGIPWPRNCLRHSYCTYHLALHHDAPKTAHELGHQNPGQLYRAYRNLATPADAAAYFEITPGDSPKT